MPRRKTNEEYIKDCKEKGIDLPIEPYVNMRTKIKHKCSKGHIYLQSPQKHSLDGRGCPICYRNQAYLTFDNVYDSCKDKGYDLPLNNKEYINNHTKMLFRCSNGHVYKQSPSHHLQGQGCPLCKGGGSYSHNVYVSKCNQLGLDLPIEPYVNSKIKIGHLCKICGYVYKQRPTDHLSHEQGCPKCNQSKGEKYISNYLDNRNILYESQKIFKDLKDKTYLSYDFYLPKYNTLIEYQGKQHYEKCDYFGGEDTLKKQQLHDKMKKNYAKNKGYELLELHYSLDTQELVDRYLSKELIDEVESY